MLVKNGSHTIRLDAFIGCICFKAFSTSWEWKSYKSKVFILFVTLTWMALISSVLTSAWDDLNSCVKYSTKVLPIISSSSCQTLLESLILVMRLRWCLLEDLVWKNDVLRSSAFSQLFLDLCYHMSSSTRSILFSSNFVSWISSITYCYFSSPPTLEAFPEALLFFNPHGQKYSCSMLLKIVYTPPGIEKIGVGRPYSVPCPMLQTLPPHTPHPSATWTQTWIVSSIEFSTICLGELSKPTYNGLTWTLLYDVGSHLGTWQTSLWTPRLYLVSL